MLPDWIQTLKETNARYITKSWQRTLAADLWIDNGSDLIQKIEQLMAENTRLRESAARVVNYWRANPDCCPSMTLEAMIEALGKALEAPK